jgi:hypothetical protein
MAIPLYKPKIFISHSAKDPLAEKLLGELAKALEEKDKFTVLWDQGVLEPSNAWRAAIDEWIWSCDAAIILLSQHALASDYVKYEVTLLRQRWKARNNSFVLIPILFPDVSAKKIDVAMGPLQLNEIQGLVLPRTEVVNDDAVVTDVIKRVLERLQSLPDLFGTRHELEEVLTEIFYYKRL